MTKRGRRISVQRAGVTSLETVLLAMCVPALLMPLSLARLCLHSDCPSAGTSAGTLFNLGAQDGLEGVESDAGFPGLEGVESEVGLG